MKSLVYTNAIGGTITFSTAPTSSQVFLETVSGLDIPNINIYQQKSPYQDGATPIDQLLDIREVVMTGAIVVPLNLSSIDTFKRTIISALNPKAGPGTLVYTNNNTSYTLRNVIPRGPLFSFKPITEPFQKLQITFYCHDPYLYSTSSSTVSLSGSTVIANAGDVMAPVSISITGACTNPTISNTTSGYSIAYVGSLTTGQTLTINTAFGNKSVKIGSSNVIYNISAASVFWGLLLGNNTITVSVGSGTPSASLTYYTRYLGA